MPKKSAAHQKKVDEAVRILNTTTGVNVRQAMILAGFPKKETTNETVHRMIRRHLEALEAKLEVIRIVPNNDADLSPLTGLPRRPQHDCGDPGDGPELRSLPNRRPHQPAAHHQRAHSRRQAKDSIAVDRRPRCIWRRGSRNRVDFWVGFPQGFFQG